MKQMKQTTLKFKPSSQKEKNNANTKAGPSSSSNTSNSQVLDCSICYDIISVRGVLDSCNHLFCHSCISNWADKSSICPVCRKRFTKILMKKETSNPSASSANKENVNPQRPVVTKIPKRDFNADEDESLNEQAVERLVNDSDEDSVDGYDSDADENGNLMDFVVSNTQVEYDPKYKEEEEEEEEEFELTQSTDCSQATPEKFRSSTPLNIRVCSVPFDDEEYEPSPTPKAKRKMNVSVNSITSIVASPALITSPTTTVSPLKLDTDKLTLSFTDFATPAPPSRIRSPLNLSSPPSTSPKRKEKQPLSSPAISDKSIISIRSTPSSSSRSTPRQSLTTRRRSTTPSSVASGSRRARLSTSFAPETPLLSPINKRRRISSEIVVPPTPFNSVPSSSSPKNPRSHPFIPDTLEEEVVPELNYDSDKTEMLDQQEIQSMATTLIFSPQRPAKKKRKRKSKQ